MPNHVTNILKIKGNETDVKFVRRIIKGREQCNPQIDFNKIIPQPAFMFNDDFGERERALCERHSTPNWSDWNRSNWGTKWGAYSQSEVDDNTIRFDTAWSSGIKVIKVLAEKFTQLDFDLIYADEDSGSNTGRVSWKAGKIVSQNFPDSQSREGYEIFLEVNPDCDCIKEVDGEFIYVDE